MSKKVEVNILCLVCDESYDTLLYRTIWIEHPENRALVFDDKINCVTCPNCAATIKVDFPILCTNVKLKFAVWYEPYPDKLIDKDAEDFRRYLGERSYHALALRITDWEEFKKKIAELEVSARERISVDRAQPTHNPQGGLVKKRQMSLLRKLQLIILKSALALVGVFFFLNGLAKGGFMLLLLAVLVGKGWVHDHEWTSIIIVYTLGGGIVFAFIYLLSRKEKAGLR